MAKAAFIISNYQLPNGQPVANGSIKVRLNTEGMANNTQLSTRFVTVSLDSNGNLEGSPLWWPNSQISPPGTSYVITIYTASGQRVSGPNKVTL